MRDCGAATVMDSGFFLDIVPKLEISCPEPAFGRSEPGFFRRVGLFFHLRRGIRGPCSPVTVRYRKFSLIPLPYFEPSVRPAALRRLGSMPPYGSAAVAARHGRAPMLRRISRQCAASFASPLVTFEAWTQTDRPLGRPVVRLDEKRELTSSPRSDVPSERSRASR